MTKNIPTPDRLTVEAFSQRIADHLQRLIDEGGNPGLVGDAAILAGSSLRLHCTGPAMLAATLDTLARRFEADAQRAQTRAH